MRRILILFALTALSAFAADVAGAWKGTMNTPMGNVEIAADLKADGSTLTGTLNFMGNDQKIEKGKVDAEKVSFEINMEFGTMQYKGSVDGDELKLTVTVQDHEDPLVLKRVQR
jgi:hypothetical protein